MINLDERDELQKVFGNNVVAFKTKEQKIKESIDMLDIAMAEFKAAMHFLAMTKDNQYEPGSDQFLAYEEKFLALSFSHAKPEIER